MNTGATLEHLTDKDPATGEYKIPKIIYSDAYFSEMVPYADLILPDTTYLERWDCISLLDRPISDPDAPADAIRQPVVAPDRDVRPFQDVLIDLGGRLKLPGFTKDDGSPKFPGGYPDYIVNHERKPGIGPLAGFRGKNGGSFGKGEPNPHQLDRYIADGCFHVHHLPPNLRYFKHANRDYIDWAVDLGLRLTRTPVIFQLYSEPMQKMRLAARGHGAVQPPEQHRRAHRDLLRSAAVLVRAVRRRRRRTRPSSRSTPSRSGRWPCTTRGDRRTPGCGRSTASTSCTSIARAPSSRASPTTTGCGSPAASAGCGRRSS